MSAAVPEGDRVLMISSDCHASPKQEVYRDYLEKRYLDDLEVVLAKGEHHLAGFRAKAASVERDETEEVLREYEARDRFATELPARLEPLDADGFATEVIFPDGPAKNEIPFSATFGSPGEYPVELHAAALRAFNRWQVETAEPERQIGLALVPLHDPGYAAEQVKNARGAVLRGVMPMWDGSDPTYPPLHDEALDEVWAACVADDLPVHFHVGVGVPGHYGRREVIASRPYVYDQEFWCRRPLWHLILGGVLERFPALKVVLTETKLDWIPRTLRYLDYEWERGKLTTLPSTPSFYYQRQVHLGATTPSVTEQQMRDDLGVERMMYGTDFPHASSPWGVSTEFLQATLPTTGYTEEEARDVLGRNAARLYHVDVAKLAPVVERVGPTMDRILDPHPDPDPLEVLGRRNPNLRRSVNRPPSLL